MGPAWLPLGAAKIGAALQFAFGSSPLAACQGSLVIHRGQWVGKQNSGLVPDRQGRGWGFCPPRLGQVLCASLRETDMNSGSGLALGSSKADRRESARTSWFWGLANKHLLSLRLLIPSGLASLRLFWSLFLNPVSSSAALVTEAAPGDRAAGGENSQLDGYAGGWGVPRVSLGLQRGRRKAGL